MSSPRGPQGQTLRALLLRVTIRCALCAPHSGGGEGLAPQPRRVRFWDIHVQHGMLRGDALAAEPKLKVWDRSRKSQPRGLDMSGFLFESVPGCYFTSRPTGKQTQGRHASNLSRGRGGVMRRGMAASGVRWHTILYSCVLNDRSYGLQIEPYRGRNKS